AGEAAAITSITIIPAAVHVRGFENDDSESPDLSLQPRRNLRGIEHLRNLEELRMDEKCGVNWTSLSGGLDCFSELRRLEHLPHLRMLCFLSVYTMNGEGEREFLRDLRPLRNLTQLTSLRISGLTSLDGIQNLTDLEYLSVWGMLSDLRGIERLTNLRNLHVSGGELTNLDEVRNLVNLTSLWAPNNQLTDISAVVRLPNLQDLGVARNQLETLPDLTVTNLQPSNTCFRGNRLSREEFERNLPASLLEANDGRWLESHLDQQR
ncbi:MAG: hypothetical protein FWB76_02630, partial [Oscillospiraceae bacterium]|nr:hypothetical protein [Oscillospiraceae bacterium]